MKTLLLVTTVVTVFVLCEGMRFDDDFPKKSHHTKSRLRGSHLKIKEGGTASLHDRWKRPSSENECVKTKCGHKEMCIVNPRTLDEKCVNKNKFREGRQLLRTFHKDKESERRFDADFLKKKFGRADNLKAVNDLLDEYNKNLHHSSKKAQIKDTVKKVPSKSKLTEAEASGCQQKDLYDLKRRLVGWSVLQHTESRMQHHREKFRKLDHWRERKSMKHFGKKPSFDLVKKDSKKHISKRSVHDTVETEYHHRCKCPKSVMWEFRKRDKNGDGSLDHDEIAIMESNRMEPCMQPLLKSCDLNSDRSLTHGEWCCCLTDTIPPCFEKKRQSDKSFYVPNCDREGYYRREQCLKDKSYCWCVDINGNEIMDTKREGRAKCNVYDPNGRLIKA